MKDFRLYLRGETMELHLDIRAFSERHAKSIARRSHGYFELVAAIEIKKPHAGLAYEQI